MQDSSYRSTEHSQNEMWLTSLVRSVWSERDVRLSLGAACLLLAWDVVISGSFVASLPCCSIWFLSSVLIAPFDRGDWRLTLFKTAIPALTLGLVLATSAVQIKIAEANAPQIIAACEAFHAANGRFPETLDELVPRYVPSVPRAKYCLVYGEFFYCNIDDSPILVWHVIPPFGRRIYSFQARRWGYID